MQHLQPNTLLHGGTYRIIKMLGQGSFGITYLAVHTNLDKKVAIKEFFMKELNSRNEDGSITGMSDGSLSYDYCQKFQKEALNLSRLDHPNIVRVTDSFEDNGTFYYVMDYIEGLNLNDYIKQYSPSESKAVELIRSVAEALIYMHEQKHMLHLDLKPGNIMRRKGDGHIFLIDFGLSKHYSNDGKPETSTTIGLGTAGYAPVEQGNRAKSGEFRPTIDVYALGATLYKLVTHDTPPAASDFIDEDVLPELLKSKGISKELSSVIINAMMPSAKKRTPSARAFLEQLSSLRESSTEEDEGTLYISKDEESETTRLIGSGVASSQTKNNDTSFVEVSKSKSSYDKDELAYKIADFIINEGYDREIAIHYLLKKENVDKGDIDTIMDEAESMVRQSNKDAGKKDVIQGSLWLLGGVIATICTGGAVLFYGAPLWGIYQICRGCKNLFIGQTYGKKNKKVSFIAIAIIVAIVAAIGIYNYSNKSYVDEYVAAYNQLNGYGVEKNTKESIEKLKKMADDDYGPAAMILAEAYSYGFYGLTADTAQANNYLTIAYNRLPVEANEGDKCAQYLMGYRYMSGLGVQRDNALAEKFLKMSADQEYDMGQIYLGLFYSNNNRPADAYKYMEKAASKDSPLALFYMAQMYANGIGTQLDSTKYVSTLKKAADMHEINSRTALGYAYIIGNSYVERSPEKGLELLEDAYSDGGIDAALYLSNCHLYGNGVEQDIEMAQRYANPIAVKYNNGSAQLLMGYSYDALGDYTSAMDWYSKAANQNVAAAQYQMALHYRDGLGVEANQEYANNWYQKAIANGYQE